VGNVARLFLSVLHLGDPATKLDGTFGLPGGEHQSQMVGGQPGTERGRLGYGEFTYLGCHNHLNGLRNAGLNETKFYNRKTRNYK
jgi:hypothetical protein